MPELPWFKCYPQDAISDPGVKRCSEATRGIWFFAWFTMQMLGTYKLEGTAEDLARDCCTSVDLVLNAIRELERTGTASITQQDGNITITCRRLLREHGITELRRKAGLASAAKRQQDRQQVVPTQVPTPSASVSASASVPSYQEGGVGGTEVTKSPDPPPMVPPAPPREDHSQLLDMFFPVFKRPKGSINSCCELQSACEIVRNPKWRDEAKEILEWYARVGATYKYFPHSLSSLLSDWTKFLDHARNQRNTDHETNRRNSDNRNIGTMHEGKSGLYKNAGTRFISPPA